MAPQLSALPAAHCLAAQNQSWRGNAPVAEECSQQPRWKAPQLWELMPPLEPLPQLWRLQGPAVAAKNQPVPILVPILVPVPILALTQLRLH